MHHPVDGGGGGHGVGEDAKEPKQMVPKAPVARTVVPVLPLSISARQRTGQNRGGLAVVDVSIAFITIAPLPFVLNSGDVMFPPVSERITGRPTEVSSSQQPATGMGETAGEQSTGHTPSFSPSPPPPSLPRSWPQQTNRK